MSSSAVERKRPRLCAISPCYNEEVGIREFYSTLKAVLDAEPDLDYSVLLVDDGSSDSTLQIINSLADTDPRVLVYSLSRNFGHQIALTAGIDVASGDLVILMDSDLQHPPQLIPRMIEKWRAGADVVSAVRLRTEDVGFFKWLGGRAFYRLINSISETPIVPDAADFVLLDHSAHEALQQMPERHRFLRGMVSWIGFRREFVEYQAPARHAGESNYTLRRMLRLASDALFSFSTAPVRLATRVGLAAVACGVLYLVYILYTLLVRPDRVLAGWSSLISVVLIMGGLQIVFIGLVGEYVARIFEETKNRPLYFFKQRPLRADRSAVRSEKS